VIIKFAYIERWRIEGITVRHSSRLSFSTDRVSIFPSISGKKNKAAPMGAASQN
jgi:hypothetical protein